MVDNTPFMTSLTEDDLNLAREAGVDLSEFFQGDVFTREGYRPIEEKDYETSWSDWARATVGVGGSKLVSDTAAGIEYLTKGAVGGDTRRYFEGVSQEQTQALSPVFRRALQSEVIPEAGRDSIFDNFALSLGAKTAAALPSIVSAIIPATAAAKVLQGASLATRVGVAGAVARGTAGLQVGGGVAGQIYSTIENMSDQELQDKASIYAGYRSMMPEAEARRQYMNDVAAAAPAAAFLLSAALGGIEGQVAGRLAGGAATGFLRGARSGALREGVQETAESAGGELLAQLALSDQNLVQMNWQKILSQGLEGGLVGGALGGGVGGVTNIGGRGEATAPDVVQLKGAGTGVASQPATGSGIGDPNARPVRSETQYLKPPSFTLDTLRSRLAGKNIEFPEARLEELQNRIDAANALPNLQRGRAINALLKDLYKLAPAAPPAPGGMKTIAPGVQVGNGPDAAQAAAFGVALPVKPIPPQVSAAVQRGPTPAPAPPVAPTRAAPPIPPKVAAAMQGRGAPVDTGTNLQQPNADLLAEQKELIGGQRAVQMFPTNTTPLPLPKGMKKSKTSRGIFHYKPNATLPDGRKVTDGLIQQLSAAGRENELLGLGDRTKQEVDAAAPAEGGVTTVSEVTPEGARVRSVASTAADAERQAQMLQENAAPGNKVVKEPSEEALAPRILQDISPEGQAATAAAAAADEARRARIAEEELAKERKAASEARAETVEGKVGKEAMLTKDEQRTAKVSEDEKVAAEIVSNNPPTDAEANLQSKDGAERKAAMQAMYDRLRKMVTEAEQRGVKIPERQRKQSDDLVLLMRAKQFLAARAPAAAKGGLGTAKPYQEFVAIETSLRGGREAAQAERDRAKAEAEAAKKPVGEAPEAAVTEERGTLSQAAEEMAMTPEDRMIAAEEARGEPAAGRERTLSASAAARAADEDAVRAVESQEGKFKSFKRPVAKNLRPTVTGKIPLKPKAAAAVAVAQKAEAKPAETAPAKPAAPAIAMKYIGDGTYLIRFGSVTMRLSTMTLSMPGTYRGLETRYLSYEQAGRLPISVYAPNTGTKVEREQADLARILNNGIYTAELAGSVIPEGLHAPITAYVEDKIDADQFFSQIQDIGRAALAEKAKAKPAERTRADQFRQSYNAPNSTINDMRANPDLADVVAYADWLGSLTDAQWEKIGPSFTAADSPFLSSITMDPVALRAKFEEILGITPQVAEPELNPSTYETGRSFVADVYHGTGSVFEKFSKAFLGKMTGAASAKKAFFFSRSPKTADHYAQLSRVTQEEEAGYAMHRAIAARLGSSETNLGEASALDETTLQTALSKLTPEQFKQFNDQFAEAQKERGFSGDYDFARVRGMIKILGMPSIPMNVRYARIEMRNPLVVDFKGEEFRAQTYDRVITDAMAAGHDGVVIQNTFDGGPQDTIYAAFNENQISDRFLPGRPEGQLFPSMPTGPQPRARVSAKPTGPTVRMAGVDFSPIQSTNVSNSMKMVSDEFYKMFRSGADRLFATFFRDKLTRRVGNVPVHIATPDDMARIYFEATGKVGVPNGIYHNGSIALNVNTVADPIAGLEVAMHEALHAWSENAINSNPGLQRALDVMVARGLDVDRSPYGLTDRYEFVSEAFSSPDFRSFLSSVELSRADRMLIEREIGPVKGPFKTALDAFLQLLRSAMGLPDTLGSYTLLDAVMRAGAKIDAIVEQQGAITGAPSTARASLSVQELINGSADRKKAFNSFVKETWVKIIPTSAIPQQYADTVIGPALRSVVDAVLSTSPRIRQIKAEGDALATRAGDLSNKYGEQFRSLTQIMEEARMMDVSIEGQNFFEKNPKTEATKYWQAKARLGDLRSRFSILPPELKQLYRDMAQFYRDSHNDIVKSSVTSILEDLQLRQVRGKAKGNALTEQQIAELTQRVMDQEMTAADKALLGETIYTSLENAAAFHRITGDYFPLMRYGDHVVTTTDKIKDTMGGKLEKPDTVLFRNKSNTKARDAAENFVANSELKDLSVRKVYFDNATNTELKNEDEAKSYNDVDIGYRVVMQTKGVYFFESRTEAEKFVRTNPEGHDVINNPEKRMGSGYEAQLMSGTQISSLNSAIDGRVKSGDITSGQGELIKSIVNQAAIRMLGGNRIASRRLKSQKVTGASQDATRNLMQYNAAAAAHMAVAESAPVIRSGLTEMSDTLKTYSGADRAQLVAVVEEVKARIDQGIVDPNAPGKVMKDIMTYAFLARLFSPAYTILQGMQVSMVTIPTLGSRFGNMVASAEVGRAYGDIGFGDLALQGMLNTARAAKQTFKASLLNTDDIVGSIRKKVSATADGADVLRMMDEAIRLGAIDGNAGLEITNAAAEGRGKYGQTLAGVDRIARQLPQMMEAVNRSVSGIAAYRLARKNGKTHEQATQFAVDIIRNTQGDYSAANSPRFFNNPILRPALMFKKYALMMTYLLGDMVYRSFNGATPEEKRMALKQITNIFAVQILVAGAFSLPGLEIFKVAFLVASALGLGGGWEEFENELRGVLDASVGKTLGEMISSGLLSRAFGNGVDLSQRMSLADMWLFGEPKGDSSESMQAYMFRQAVGAPGGYLLDVRDAAVLASEGEFAKAFGKFIPVKFIADFTKAAYGYGEAKYEVPEKRAVSGAGELAFNALGFRTGRQAELGRERGIAIRERQDKQKEFKKLQKQYYSARTKGDMAKAIAKNREWNGGLSKNEFRMRLPVKPRELRVPQ